MHVLNISQTALRSFFFFKVPLSVFLPLFLSLSVLLSTVYLSLSIPPKEGRGSDVSPLSGISGLSFDSTLRSPLLFFCLVLLPFLSNRFLPAGPFF